MSSEAEIIIAFLYKRSGKPVLTESELYLSLSMDMGWMTATEAQAFVQQMKDDKIVHPSDGGFAPSFDVTTVETPRGFTPSKKIRGKEPPVHIAKESLLDQIVRRICECTKRPIPQLSREIAALAAEKNIAPEVAALWVARRHDCDVSDFYDAVETFVMAHTQNS